jgi:hypothetical protein
MGICFRSLDLRIGPMQMTSLDDEHECLAENGSLPKALLVIVRN